MKILFTVGYQNKPFNKTNWKKMVWVVQSIVF